MKPTDLTALLFERANLPLPPAQDTMRVAKQTPLWLSVCCGALPLGELGPSERTINMRVGTCRACRDITSFEEV